MTTMKSMILAAALGLASMSFASAKTYNVVLSSATEVGNAELAAGSYKLNLDGHVATFTNVDTNKSVMVLVRVGTSTTTHDRTAVETKKENGTQRVEAIELENSTNTLEF